MRSAHLSASLNAALADSSKASSLSVARSAFGSCGAGPVADRGVHLLGGEAALADGLRRQPFRLGEERGRQLRRADRGAGRALRLPVRWMAGRAIGGEVIGGEQYPNGAIGETGERLEAARAEVIAGLAGHEALLRGLLGDAHGGADLAPGQAGPAGLVDEVPEHRVRLLVELLGDRERVRDVLERAALGVQGLHVRDEVVQRDRKFSHGSTLG